MYNCRTKCVFNVCQWNVNIKWKPENFRFTKWKLEILWFPLRKPENFRFPFDPELSQNSGLRNKFPDHSISKMEIFSGKMETLIKI